MAQEFECLIGHEELAGFTLLRQELRNRLIMLLLHIMLFHIFDLISTVHGQPKYVCRNVQI